MTTDPRWNLQSHIQKSYMMFEIESRAVIKDGLQKASVNDRPAQWSFLWSYLSSSWIKRARWPFPTGKESEIACRKGGRVTWLGSMGRLQSNNRTCSGKRSSPITHRSISFICLNQHLKEFVGRAKKFDFVVSLPTACAGSQSPESQVSERFSQKERSFPVVEVINIISSFLPENEIASGIRRALMGLVGIEDPLHEIPQLPLVFYHRQQTTHQVRKAFWRLLPRFPKSEKS